MNHQVLQDSIGLQREVKSLMGEIHKGKGSVPMMKLRPSNLLRNGAGMNTQSKLSRERRGNQQNVENAEDITYTGTSQRGNIKRAVATKFLDFGISQELRTSKRSTCKPRGLVLAI